MKYGGDSLKTAATQVVKDLELHGGQGGLIALDNRGRGAQFSDYLNKPLIEYRFSDHASQL